MASIVFNVFDPSTHAQTLSINDFALLSLAEFDTTTAGSMTLDTPPGANIVIGQVAASQVKSPGTVSVSGNTVSWTAGAQSHVSIMAF